MATCTLIPSSLVGGYQITDASNLAIEKNKIIYGNKTLIDLTSDTVTESDVVSGVMFHLPSGKQATGTLVSAIKTKEIRIDTGYDNSIVFNNVTSEPSWFVVVGTSLASASAALNNPVVYVLYDGTKTSMMYITASSSSKVLRTITSSTTTTSYPRFSYDGSSSKLTVSVTGTAASSRPNFQAVGDKYTLYYL